MRMACALGVVVLASAACGSSAAAPAGPSPGSIASAACGPSGARTLAANARARIFSRNGSVYGCARAGQRTYLLGRSSLARPGEGRIGVVALGGVDAAYSTSQMGVDTLSAEIVVRRLDNGRTIRTASATTQALGPEFAQSVDALVVKSDGAVAWIATGGSIIRHAKTTEVDRIDRRGEATLDRGSQVGLQSLRLRGSQLRWRHGSVTRSSTLL